jgi:hypothetical protein
MTTISINKSNKTVNIDIDYSDTDLLANVLAYLNLSALEDHRVVMGAKSDSVLCDRKFTGLKVPTLSLYSMNIVNVPMCADSYNFTHCFFKGGDIHFDDVKDITIKECHIIDGKVSFTGNIETLTIDGLNSSRMHTLHILQTNIKKLILRNCHTHVVLPTSITSLEVYDSPDVVINFTDLPKLTSFKWLGTEWRNSWFPLRLLNKDNLNIIPYLNNNNCIDDAKTRIYDFITSINIGSLKVLLYANDDSKKDGIKFDYSEVNGDFKLDTNLDIVVKK